MSCVVEFA